MEKLTNCSLMLSLNEIALRRLAVNLCNDPEILAMLNNFRFDPVYYSSYVVHERDYFESVKCKVADKVSKLGLPKSLKKQMMPIIHCVCLEILEWRIFYKAEFSNSNERFCLSILEKLCWTPAGTVDYRNTAEKLVCCDEIDIVTRFDLACLYCFENYIQLLWKELPVENQRAFYNEDVISLDETPNMQLFIPYILRKLTRMFHLSLSDFQNTSFEYSALYGSKALTECSFKKLTKEKREVSLVKTAKSILNCQNNDSSIKNRIKNRLSGIFCYLLSEMTPEEQIGIFKEQPWEVLMCFLTWSCQDLFFDIADLIWTFLPETEYKNLVFKILAHIKESLLYFPNFFHNFFLRSPINFRKCFVDQECFSGYFFSEFFYNQDTEPIKVLLRNVDAADRLRLLCSESILEFICFCAVQEWHILAEYLLSALLSKNDKEKVKEAVMNYVNRQNKGSKIYYGTIDAVQIDTTDQGWIEFIAFLDETDVTA